MEGKEYYESGSLKYEGHYDRGQFEGEGKEYYESGSLKFEGQYQHGLKHGRGKEYNEEGILTNDGRFDNDTFMEDDTEDENYDTEDENYDTEDENYDTEDEMDDSDRRINVAELIRTLSCSVSLDIMTDPVIDRDGNTWDRSSILRCVRDKRKSPLTRKKLFSGDLLPNLALKNIIAVSPTSPGSITYRMIKEYLKCPIGHNVMTDPVIDRDGNTYERKAILRWVRDNGTSPLTRTKLFSSDTFVPNLALKYILDTVVQREGPLGGAVPEEQGEQH
jgi:hypothetical protein